MCGALQSLLLLLCTRRTCWTSLRYSSSVACRWKPLALASSGGKPSSCARKCCPVVYLQHTQKEQGWGEICQHNSSLLCTTYRATPFSIPCKCAVPHFEISCTVHRLGGCWACKGVIKCPLHWTPQMPQKHHTGYARQHSSEQHTLPSAVRSSPGHLWALKAVLPPSRHPARCPPAAAPIQVCQQLSSPGLHRLH